MNKYYDLIIRDSEKRAELVLKKQVLDESRFDYGGVQILKAYVEVKQTIYKLSTSIAVYLNPKSKYYKNEQLLERINLGLDYVKRVQREDGTFDLASCNFYSAPDTAFCIKRLIPSYHILDKYGFDENCTALKNKIYEIIKAGAYGMVNGGFHTPNHRWAIASILMACYGVVKDEALKKRAEEYLIEGIDCNEYGEYAERSAAIYNVVNNAAMIALYEETGNEEYINYVHKNLEMMLSYFDPDGSIFTNNSTRQDKGRKVYPRDYFYQYLYLANKFNNKTFEAAAHKIIQDNKELRYRKAPDCLDQLMLHPELLDYELKEYGFLKEYHCYYPSSGSIRVQKNSMSYSIIKDASQFLFFSSGSLQMNMKIGVSYCEHRAFKAQTIEKTEDSYVLKFKARGWYYLPFDKAPDTTDWWEMDNSSRKMIYKKDLNIVVTVKEVENGIDVNVCASGCDRVPVRVEIGVPGGSSIDSENFYSEGNAGEALLVRSGMVNVSNDIDEITVGPGFGTHQYLSGKYGSEARNQDNFTIYFSDYTEFNHTIKVRGN